MKWLLSGDSGNTDPDFSLGGGRSSTEVIFSPTLQNLFDNVTSDEALSGLTEYRCIYLQNDHATDSVDSVKLWISANTPSASTTIEIGLDPAGKNGLADTISPSTEAPAGVTFSAPTTEGTGLSIGLLQAQDVYPVWIKRTVSASAAATSLDNFILDISGIPL
jgi:hypothetical protein